MANPFSDPTLFAVLLMLLSPAVGSFLTVLIDRLPRGEGVALPGSRCRSCDARLGLRDLVPVLSFALSRGRCRQCGAAIAPWHLYVELSAVGFAAFAVAMGGGVAAMGLSALVLWVLLALAVTDLLWFRLPDLLTATLAVLALIWAALFGDIITALIGAGIGAGAFWLLRVGYRAVRGREGLGLGDVKLMVGLGALSGPWLLSHLALIAALLALTVALAQRARLESDRALPFGAALAAAGAALWILGRTGV